ncbi:MAG TPA: hypothetical protein VNT22_08570 [Baekduia sp.]|nr:hypothetical protein [Baekduia sp.]
MSLLKSNKTGLWVVLSSVLLAALVTPFAFASGEGKDVRGGARNPSSNSSLSYSKETQLIANTSTYGTRQSNKSTSGGGAVYGCRSLAGGTPAHNEPCVRASNLNTGLAFEFASAKGTLGGTIAVGAGGDAVKPFTTNATGVATGLNADRVDGKDVDTLAPFAKVSAGGNLDAKRGAITSVTGGAGAYAVNFSSDISACAFTVTVSQAGGGIGSFSIGADNKTVNVETRDFAGAAAARAFNLVGSC